MFAGKRKNRKLYKYSILFFVINREKNEQFFVRFRILYSFSEKKQICGVKGVVIHGIMVVEQDFTNLLWNVNLRFLTAVMAGRILMSFNP